MSWLATATGFLLFLVFGPIAIAQFGPAALRFNFGQGNIELTIDFSGVIGSITRTAGFSLGNFTFLYSGPQALTAMAASSIANVGGSQAHLNMQPFLVLNFSIALQGIFPSQT